MSSIRRIRKSFEERDNQFELWVQEIRDSRIILRSDDTSYLHGVGVYVSTINRRLNEGVSHETLIQDYPGLTEDDIRLCVKFEIVRLRGKL